MVAFKRGTDYVNRSQVITMIWKISLYLMIKEKMFPDFLISFHMFVTRTITKLQSILMGLSWTNYLLT